MAWPPLSLDPGVPHRFPFRFIDPLPRQGTSGLEATIEVGLTANAALLRGEGPLSLFLLVEIAAQAVLHLAAGDAPQGQVLLAGVEEMSLAEGAELRPPLPGDRLSIRAQEEARIARLIKMRVEIEREGRPLAAGVLLLATS